MPDPIKYSNNIKKTADIFLAENKVIEALSNLGEVQIVGSYMYNLMTWQDLDILVVNTYPTKELSLKIGDFIFKGLNPLTVRFEDRVVQTSNSQPQGYYWEALTSNNWVIKAWLIDKEESKKQAEIRKEIYDGLTDEKRRLIIELKMDPNYMKSYSGIDVYTAVLQDNIKSQRDFLVWLNRP